MLGIREATPDDNDALLRLEAESPQGTGISIVVDREDYFYRSRLHASSRVLIAEEDEKLVGVMAYAIKEVFVEGARDRVAYFYDLRGEVAYRRSMKRGLFRLWRTALQGMEEAGASFAYGHVKADNHDALGIFAKLGAQRLSSFDVLSVPSIRGGVPVLDPHLNRLDDEVERIRSLTGTRNLTPCDLSAAYTVGAELGYLRGIYRLEQAGSMAQVSAWDVSSVCRGRVLRMPLSLRVLARVLNPLSTVLPVPRIPRAGEQMGNLQLFDPVCRGDAGKRLLRNLIQQLRRLAYAEGLGILTLFVYRDDPLGELPAFFPQQVLHYDTLALDLRGGALPEERLYLDVRDI